MTKLQDFASHRNSSFITQFVQIFIRNGRYLYRNKQALGGVIANSLIISLLILSVFWHIGTFPTEVQYAMEHPTEENIKEANIKYQSYIQNLTGLAFMIGNQLSISASINVIIQVPLQAPVMKREFANKMYSPTAYYLGRYLSTLIL